MSTIIRFLVLSKHDEKCGSLMLLVKATANFTQAILQRVASASVTVDKQLISSIGRGVLVFAAIGPNDTKKDAESMASKVLKMKMWPDEAGSCVC